MYSEESNANHRMKGTVYADFKGGITQKPENKVLSRVFDFKLLLM